MYIWIACSILLLLVTLTIFLWVRKNRDSNRQWILRRYIVYTDLKRTTVGIATSEKNPEAAVKTAMNELRETRDNKPTRFNQIQISGPDGETVIITMTPRS